MAPDRVDSFRRSICNFRNRQDEIHDQFVAEQAEARAQAEAEGRREADKEVAAIRKFKDFRARNEEEHDLIMQAAKACMFDTEDKLLPPEDQDRANFARCMTVAGQLTAQIKPMDDKSSGTTGKSAIIAYVESERSKGLSSK